MTEELSLEAATTFLFVPGNRPERFLKAAGAGADAVIIDLEDAVPAEAQAAALKEAIAILSSGEMRALVRVHPTSDARYEAEVDALLGEAVTGLHGIVVAKADDPQALLQLAGRLRPGQALVPLIESAAGLDAAKAIASVPGVTRLAFGGVDYSLDIGARPVSAALDFARSHLVVASRVSSIAAPLDSPPLSITDLDGVEAGAYSARSLGFGGSLAIHPAQLAPLSKGFAPTADEIEWARAVLAAEGDAGAGQVNGQLVDRPVFDRARNILREAGN